MPNPCKRTLKRLHHAFRRMTYEGMSHQASDWIPEELRATNETPDTKPIKISFNVAKRNRLSWIRRSMHQ